jgi:lipopolysaccharide biosynthesis glycosyltransferase
MAGHLENAGTQGENKRMKSIIVSGADENFAGLLTELLDSLRQWKEPLSNTIGILDVGLSESSKKQLSQYGCQIVEPTWDFVIDDNITAQKPYLRAMTSRPFLPKYFPGYDLYLWLDADTWVQNKFAVEWLFQAAKNGDIAIVPEIHRSYYHNPGIINWRLKPLQDYFSSEAVQLYYLNRYFNTGIFALRRDAPHWNSWEKYFQSGLNTKPNTVEDQTALNYAIWKEKLPVHPLPAICNWCCNLAIPILNRKTNKFCEPHIPHREIGIVHMTGHTKDLKWSLGEGRSVESLHYRDLQTARPQTG